MKRRPDLDARELAQWLDTFERWIGGASDITIQPDDAQLFFGSIIRAYRKLVGLPTAPTRKPDKPKPRKRGKGKS